MPKKKRQKPDESTYKSEVFGSPVVRALIIIAIAAFIFVLFAGDAFRILQGASATDTYIRVNGEELFVTNYAGRPQLSKEARNIINTLGYLNRQMSESQYNPQQFQSMMENFYRGSIDNLVTEEIYNQEAKKADITIPVSEFYAFANRDYNEIIERIESQEPGSKRELPPASLDAHEAELKYEYRKNNIQRPIEEAVILSDLDIIHRHKITDSTSIVKYAFYGFNDFLNESIDEIVIEDQTLIDFLSNNKKVSITTELIVDVLVFDNREEAEKATMESNPFTMEEYQDNIIKSIPISRIHRYFDELKDIVVNRWKIDVLLYQGKSAIYKVIEKKSSSNFQEITEAGAVDELIKEYLRENSTEYTEEFQTKAKEIMDEFRSKVSSGEDFFQTAKEMNLNVYGKTKEMAMNQDSPQPNEKEPQSLNSNTKNKHITALRKAANDGNFVLYAFTTGQDKVSDVLNTSANQELGIFTEDDYYYVVQPIQIELAEELTDARKKTITDNLKSEIENDFKQLKMEYLRKQNKVVVEYPKIRQVIEDSGVMAMPEPTETETPPTTGGDGGGLGIGGDGGGLGIGGDGGGLGIGGDGGGILDISPKTDGDTTDESDATDTGDTGETSNGTTNDTGGDTGETSNGDTNNGDNE